MGPSPNSHFGHLSSAWELETQWTRTPGSCHSQCLQIHTCLCVSFTRSHFLEVSIMALRCQAAVLPPGWWSQPGKLLSWFITLSVISKEPAEVSRSYVKCLVDGRCMPCVRPVQTEHVSHLGGLHQNHLGLFFFFLQVQMHGDCESVKSGVGPSI